MRHEARQKLAEVLGGFLVGREWQWQLYGEGAPASTRLAGDADSEVRGVTGFPDQAARASVRSTYPGIAAVAIANEHAHLEAVNDGMRVRQVGHALRLGGDATGHAARRSLSCRIVQPETSSVLAERGRQPYGLRMGMHFGFMIVASDWRSVMSQLEAACGRFEDRGPVSRESWFDTPRGEDVIHVAEVNGQTFLFEPSMVVTCNADLAVGLSGALSCRLVAAGAETLSGTIWFFAADHGAAQRVHFDVWSQLTEPFDLGEPLSSEATVDWRDIDGDGVLAAASAFGMHTEPLTAGPSSGRAFSWPVERLPDRGEIERQISMHCEQFKAPDADQWMSRITAVGRPSDSDMPSAPSRGRRRWFGRR